MKVENKMKRQIIDGQGLLSRSECNIMRGFAILAIVSNNFGHLLKGIIQDNEFVYNYNNVVGFLDQLKTPTSNFCLDLLAFYSPFGVMLFIFLSGFGLTLKYENTNVNSVTHKEFVFDHYRKLFQMQMKGLALFLLVMFVFDPDYIVYFRHLLGQLFMVENLNPIDQKILGGPYWFFGMIMEIYLIYRYVIYRRSTTFIIFVILLSLLVMSVCAPNGDTIRYLRINFCMALLPFCIGVLLARYGRLFINIVDNRIYRIFAIIVFFVLLTLCKFNFYSWLFMPIFIIGVSVPLTKLLSQSKLFANIFGWVGELSGVLFVVHPIVREILFQRVSLSGNYYGMFFVYLFLTIALSVILKPLFVK